MKEKPVPAGIGLCCPLTVTAVLTGFFAKFWLGNPDTVGNTQYCWGSNMLQDGAQNYHVLGVGEELGDRWTDVTS